MSENIKFCVENKKELWYTILKLYTKDVYNMQLNDVSNIANTPKTTSFDMVLWIILFVSLICKYC